MGAAAVIFSAHAAQAAIFVDQDAEWRYVNATAATTQAVPANWFEPGFDDSGWFVGVAPFTTSPGNPASTFGADLANAGAPFGGAAPAIPASGTLWTDHRDPYLRLAFELPAPTALTIWLGVDNGINAMYLNGVLATASVNAEGPAARWEHVFDIGAAFTFAGTNLLALQLEDHGFATAFMAVVTSDDAADNKVFSDNEPPPAAAAIPEPATLAVLAVGLAGAAGWRRRCRATVNHAA